MTYLSLFSGIEAATAAWKPLGWTAAAFAEVDKACCRLLASKYPSVPNLGDVTQISKSRVRELGHIDIVIFGSPCQDLSIAGKRGGLKGERSGLFFDAMRIVRWSGARFALWENVPGAFSSNEGRDFAAVVGEMAGSPVDTPEAGWRNTGVVIGDAGLVEWSVLDAQWFGVPQRRRRIFALADFGDWANRPPILLEPESMFGNPPTRGEAREDVAGTISARTEGGGGLGTDFDIAGGFVASTLNASMAKGKNGQDVGALVTHSLCAEGFDASEDGTGRGIPLVPIGLYGNDSGNDAAEDLSPTLRSMCGGGGNHPSVMAQSAVRRLTPKECERLQGFEDGYTFTDGKANGPRYKALGNSMAVPVIRWIGSRIMEAANV